MGTRHIIKVVKNNKTWIGQYGQWDGYPTGQGCDIIAFIRDRRYVGYLANAIDRGDIVPITEEQYNRKMAKLAKFTEKDGMLNEMVNQMFLTSTFSRDMGAKCLKVFARPLEGRKYAVVEEPSGWEQYQYTLDLDMETLKIEELRDTDPQSVEFPFYQLAELNDENAHTLMKALEDKWKEIHEKEKEKEKEE